MFKVKVLRQLGTWNPEHGTLSGQGSQRVAHLAVAVSSPSPGLGCGGGATSEEPGREVKLPQSAYGREITQALTSRGPNSYSLLRNSTGFMVMVL